MIDLEKTLELWGWVRELSADSPSDPTAWLDPLWAGGIATAIGFILAMWGGRVLRVGFVFVFMAIGAILGKRFAGSIQIDLLIGLVVGAAIAGAIGYVIYRWCLGLTVATVIGLVVAATFSAPTLLNERQAFDDFRLGVGTAQYLTSADPMYSWEAARSYFWEQPRGREVTIRALGPVVLTGLLGFLLSILAPRFASVLVTSILGTVLFVAGAGVLMARYWPAAYARIQGQTAWVAGAAIFFWLVALVYQTTHPARPAVQVLVPAAPAPTS